MNSVDRTHLVLQPFQANRVNPDRRRGQSNKQPFDLEASTTSADPKSRVEITTDWAVSPGGDEGVGEHVNIVV